jgi:hypothetical protein
MTVLHESSDAEQVLFRSPRSYRTVGTFLVGLFFLLIAYPLFKFTRFSEAGLSAKVAAGVGLFMAWCFIRLFLGGFFANHKIELLVTTAGIRYGQQFYPWEKISKIYPYGGLNWKGRREFILGCEVGKGFITRGDKFPLDKRLSTEEFRALCGLISEHVLPAHPHLDIRDP